MVKKSTSDLGFIGKKKEASPNLSSDGKVKKKKNKSKAKIDGKKPEPRVVRIDEIPHGFYEDQLTKYFTQFGEVLATNVPRSIITGNPSNIGYVTFKSGYVAKTACETMHNYIMFDCILKCSLIDEVPNWQQPQFKITKDNIKLLRERVQRNFNRKLTVEEHIENRDKLIREIELSNAQLKLSGVDFQFQVNSESMQFKHEKMYPLKSTRDKEIEGYAEFICDRKKRKLPRDLTQEKFQKIMEADKKVQMMKVGKILKKDADGKKRKIVKLEDLKIEPKGMNTSSSSIYTLLVDASDDEVAFLSPPKSKRKVKSK